MHQRETAMPVTNQNLVPEGIFVEDAVTPYGYGRLKRDVDMPNAYSCLLPAFPENKLYFNNLRYLDIFRLS